MTDQQIAQGAGPTPVAITVQGSEQLLPKLAFAAYDGSGAAGDFLPVVKLIGPGGKLAGQAVGDVVTAGGSVDQTWFRGLAKPPPPAGPAQIAFESDGALKGVAHTVNFTEFDPATTTPLFAGVGWYVTYNVPLQRVDILGQVPGDYAPFTLDSTAGLTTVYSFDYFAFSFIEGRVRPAILATYTNNTGVAHPLRIQISIGGVPLWDATTAPIPSSANPRVWYLEAVLTYDNFGHVPGFRLGGFTAISDATPPAVGQGSFAAPAAQGVFGGFDNTVDPTQDNIFDISVDLGAADPALSVVGLETSSLDKGV